MAKKPDQEEIQTEIAETAQPVSATDLARDMGQDMPEPSTPDPENPNRADNAPAPAAVAPAAHTPANLIDARGRQFDPAIHRADEAGRPMRDKKGNFYSKNLGRPSNTNKTAPAPAPQRPPPTFSDPNQEPLPFAEPMPAEPMRGPIPDRFAQLAEVYLYSAYGPIVVLLGEEAKPDDEEHQALKDPLTAYLRSINARDISPGWAFLITAVAIAMKKMEKPSVRERFQILVMRCKQIGARISARFSGKDRQ